MPADVCPLPARGGWRWRQHQADALHAWAHPQAPGDGLLLPLGVGAGKTHVLLGIAALEAIAGRRRIAYLTSSPLVAQLVERDVPAARLAYLPEGPRALRVVSLALPGHAARIAALAPSEDPTLFVAPYSLLALPEAIETLSALDAETYLCDEAHALRSLTSATTRRLLSMVRPGVVRWAFASGTITSRGCEDYAHLAACACQERSPAPLHPSLRRSLDDVIAAGSRPSRYAIGLMGRLRSWAGVEDDSVPGVRAAWRNRLVSHPAVIAAEDDRPGASLLIRRLEHGSSPEVLEHHRRLSHEWVSPSGEELSDAMAVWHWRYQLCSGFYYATEWATEEDRERHQRRNRYHASLRRWLLERYRPGLDTPALCEARMDELPASVQRSYWDSREEPQGRTYPVRVCDARVRAAADWLSGAPGVLWYVHGEVGQWLRELCPWATYCPASDEGTAALQAAPASARVIASLRAFGKGFNLQRWRRMGFAQWARGSAACEQALGRMHRSGQEADEVEAVWWSSAEHGHDRDMFAATVADAAYAHEAMQPQRILYGAHDPPIGRSGGVSARSLFGPQEA